MLKFQCKKKVVSDISFKSYESYLLENRKYTVTVRKRSERSKERRENHEERIPESKRKPEHYKRNHQRKNAAQIKNERK